MTQQQPSADRDAAVFPFLCLAIFVIYLDSTLVNVALPTIQHDLGAPIAELQWVANCYTLALASLLLSAGAVCDRLGRKTVLVAGLAGFGLSSAACALSGSLGALLAARCAQGAAAALLVPPCIASLPRCFPNPKRRARAIGQLSAVASLGTAVGPVLGGWLVQQAQWQSLFWINVPLAAVALMGALATLRREAPAVTRPLDVPGQVLMIGTLALLTYAIVEGPTLGWRSPALGMLLGAGIVLGLAFIRHERRARHPLWPKELTTNRSVMVACASNFFGLLSFFATQFVLVFWFQRAVGEPALAVGRHLLWMTLAMMLVSPLIGRWMARSGARVPMIAGVVACGLGVAVLATIPAGLGAQAIDGSLALMGCGIAAIAAAGTAAIVSGVAPASVGVVSGAASTLRQLGAVIGVAVAAAILSATDARGGSVDYATGLSGALAIAALSCLLLLALVLRWFEPTRRTITSEVIDTERTALDHAAR